MKVFHTFCFMFIRDFVYVYLWTFLKETEKRNEMVMVRAEMRSMSEYTEKKYCAYKKEKSHSRRVLLCKLCSSRNIIKRLFINLISN